MEGEELQGIRAERPGPDKVEAANVWDSGAEGGQLVAVQDVALDGAPGSSLARSVGLTEREGVLDPSCLEVEELVGGNLVDDGCIPSLEQS